MRLVLLAAFVLTGSVVCINNNDNSDQSVVQRRYNFNHPPLAENYNQVPVMVVHENDVITEKSRKPESKEDSSIEEVSHRVRENKQLLKSVLESEKKDQYVKPKAKILDNLQIPVAVIYDSVPSSSQTPRRSKSNETNIPRRKYNKLRRRKQQNETSTEKEKLMNIQNTELVKPEPLKVESVKQNPSSTETHAKGEETNNTERVKPEALKEESVRQNPSSTETHVKGDKTKNTERIKPEALKVESVRQSPSSTETYAKGEETKNTERVKPEALKVESVRQNPSSTETHEKGEETKNTERVKPEALKVEPIRKNPSITETHAKGEETKRERVPVVPIIESENNVYAHSGNFHYSYEGGDGTKAHSEGRLRTIEDKAAGEAVSGGFSYTDKEGNNFSLSYTADEKGYRPVGAHLPTPPPIPPAIARALAYLATATTPEPVTKPTVQ